MRHTALKTLATATQTPAATGYTYYLPDCQQLTFDECYYNGKINGVFVKHIENGDTIVFPAGSATWGYGASANNGRQTWITHSITVTGQGDSTVISIASEGKRYTLATINLWSTVTWSNMKIIGAPTGSQATVFNSQPYNNSARQSGSVNPGINYTGGGRITNVTFESPSTNGPGYFFYGGTVQSFLIDNCRLTANAGNAELIFVRGPTNAWQVNNTLGGADNIFVENCTFNTNGYVNDANSNGRMVVRFCTINGPIKVDGHGLASNSAPARGFRCMETYHNTWTYNAAFWTAIEIRGGTTMTFNNTTTNNYGNFFMTDYGAFQSLPNFGYQYQTPASYPITDQVGVGKDPKVAASEPAYIWGNRVGASLSWRRQNKAIPQAAIDFYRTQTGDPTSTYTERDLIRANRDFYAEAGFETSTNGAPVEQQAAGVSIGTKAQMLAFTPPFAKYGWWVTDEGTWNRTPGGPQGRLYTWNGSSWNVYYEPYTYPHPLRT
jgi:hypothetical protein